MIRFLSLVFLICFSYVLSAQPTTLGEMKKKSGKISRYGLIMDQDLLAETFGLKGKNEDRNYTMGLGLFLTNSQWGEAKFFSPFRWVAKKTFRGWSKAMFKAEEYEPAQSATISIGMTGFTPRYLGDNTADSLYYMINDRPFSSYTFISMKYQTNTRRKVETNQLVIGAMGWGIGRDVQTYIHENHWFGSTREIPYGWKYQMNNGGKFAFLLSNRADILLNDESSFKSYRQHRVNTQFIASREYRVGYYTSASAGIGMRIGLLDPNNWTSYDTYQLGFASQKKVPIANGPAPVEYDRKMGMVAGLTATAGKPKPFPLPMESKRNLEGELYFQALIRPQLMIYNQHLQGRGKRLAYVYHVNHFIVEGLAGVGGAIPSAKNNFSMNLFLYLSGRTAEIKSAVSNRSHIWGGIMLNFTRIKP